MKPGRTIGLAVMGLVCVVFGACRSPEAALEASPDAARLARLKAQLEAMDDHLPRWESWLAEVKRLDEEYRLDRRTDHALYDADTMRSIAEPGSLFGDGGPLATILSVARQLETRGIDLLVLPVPSRAATYPELLGIPTPLTRGEQPPLLDRYLREFYLKLEESGVEVLDVQPAFLEHRFNTIDGPPAQPGPFSELLFRIHDPHWTSYGAAVAAEVVGTRVREYPWFEAAQRQFGQGVLVEKDFWRNSYGPMVRSFIREGRSDPNAPREQHLERRVWIEGEKWSMSDRTSPILLIGDSFLNPRRGFADQILKVLGFRADTIFVSGGVPSNLAALRLRADRLEGKKLVVWEFVAFGLANPERWRPVDILGDGAG